MPIALHMLLYCTVSYRVIPSWALMLVSRANRVTWPWAVSGAELARGALHKLDIPDISAGTAKYVPERSHKALNAVT